MYREKAVSSSPRRRSGRRTCLVVALAFFSLVGIARADLRTAPSRTFVTDGPVLAIAATSAATYIGGEFDTVGPRTGPGVGINAATGKSSGFPEVAGGSAVVTVVAPDRSGGFYVGGNFKRVGNTLRRNLVHILADGSVDPKFNPSPNNSVDALAVSGPTLYVSGHFSMVGGRTRHSIAALNTTSGRATAWNPNPKDGKVVTLAVSGSTVYAGGGFATIGGKPRSHVGSVGVDALAISGATVYAGGEFQSVGGQPRRNLVAIDGATAGAASWNPSPAGDVESLAVGPDGSLWAGGRFRVFPTVAQSGIAKFAP